MGKRLKRGKLREEEEEKGKRRFPKASPGERRRRRVYLKDLRKRGEPIMP